MDCLLFNNEMVAFINPHEYLDSDGWYHISDIKLELSNQNIHNTVYSNPTEYFNFAIKFHSLNDLILFKVKYSDVFDFNSMKSRWKNHWKTPLEYKMFLFVRFRIPL